MTADGFSIGVGTWLANSASAYFKRFGKLPPRGTVVPDVVALTGAETLETLLAAVAASKQTDFLFYAHGMPDGSGLYIRFATRRGTPFGASTTADRLNTLLRLEGGKNAGTDRELAFLGLEQGDANRLFTLIRAIRAKKLDTVEFRGCNLGKNPTSVDTFKKLFSCKTFGAPDLYSFFGDNPVYTDQQLRNTHRTWRTRLESRDHSQWMEYPFAFDKPVGNLIVVVSVGNVQDVSMKPLAGYIVADSTQTVDRWVKANIDKDGSYTSGNLTIHGMWDRGQGKIDIQNVPIGEETKLPDPQLIMPVGPGDYKSHVIYK